MLALVLGALVIPRLATFAADGPPGYRDPSILGEPGLWILTLIVVASGIDFAGRFAPGLEGIRPVTRRTSAMMGLLLVAIAAAAMGLVLHGSLGLSAGRRVVVAQHGVPQPAERRVPPGRRHWHARL